MLLLARDHCKKLQCTATRFFNAKGLCAGESEITGAMHEISRCERESCAVRRPLSHAWYILCKRGVIKVRLRAREGEK